MDKQHKKGTTNSNVTRIEYKPGSQIISVPIYDPTSILPNTKYYFIEGEMKGQTFAFLLESNKRSKKNPCGTPEGGTQTDDRPNHQFLLSIFQELNPNSKLENIDLLKLLDQIVFNHTIVLWCSTLETPVNILLIHNSVVNTYNTNNPTNKITRWTTFGFDYYFDANLGFNVINDPDSIKNVDNSNW